MDYGNWSIDHWHNIDWPIDLLTDWPIILLADWFDSSALYVCADGAAFEKNRIEELQRSARKDRKKHHEEFTPR